MHLRIKPLISLAIVAALAAACGSGPSPRVGDHWHASYAVNICGAEVPPFPAFDGGVRTLGDGVIHMQPSLASEEGEGARLVQFFQNAGGELTGSSIQLPGESPWRNGDICPGGRPGRVMVIVDRALGDEVEKYVPQDGDLILIAFVASGSLRPLVPQEAAPADHAGENELVQTDEE